MFMFCNINTIKISIIKHIIKKIKYNFIKIYKKEKKITSKINRNRLNLNIDHQMISLFIFIIYFIIFSN